MIDFIIGAVALTVLVGGSLALYLLPLIVGLLRRVPDIGSVAVINVLLGWTLVGWAAAMALALRSAVTDRPSVQIVQHLPPASALPALPPPGWAGRPGYAPRRDPPPLVLPARPADPWVPPGPYEPVDSEEPPGSYGTPGFGEPGDYLDSAGSWDRARFSHTGSYGRPGSPETTGSTRGPDYYPDPPGWCDPGGFQIGEDSNLPDSDDSAIGRSADGSSGPSGRRNPQDGEAL